MQNHFVMQIDDLTDDCLLAIFSHLSIVQRINLERVSQRWRELILSSFSSIKILDVAEFTKTTYKSFHQQDNIYFVPTVQSLISKSRSKLKEICFGDRWFNISQPIVDSIASDCSKLTKLDFGHTVMDANILQLLKKLAPFLVQFSLEDTHWVHTEDAEGIERCFPLMKQLKRINLRRAPFSLTTLPELPESLDFINLCGARRLSLNVLECFLLNHYQLTEFRLNGFHKIQQSTIDILSNLVTLVVLEISLVIADEDIDLSPLSNLINIEELYLQSNNCLQDNSFRNICQCCTSIQVLNVGACKRLFDFSALAYCRNVKRFYCSNTVQICDEDLLDMARNCSLEYINLVYCVNVSNIGVLEIAKMCPLKEICIAQCPDVTDTCLIQLVDNHRPIDRISVQNCKITNEGVRSLAKVENLLCLKELDLSYNRTVNEASLLPIYQALVDRLGHNSDLEKRLTIYVHQTAVATTIERLVQSHIRLMY